MRLFMIFAAFVAGFLLYQEHQSNQRQYAFDNLLKKIAHKPLDQFEIKRSLYTQVKARCESISDNDMDSSEECLNLAENFKQECDRKVFRLAPIEFIEVDNVLDYSKRYQKCLFSRQYAYLINANNLL